MKWLFFTKERFILLFTLQYTEFFYGLSGLLVLEGSQMDSFFIKMYLNVNMATKSNVIFLFVCKIQIQHLESTADLYLAYFEWNNEEKATLGHKIAGQLTVQFLSNFVQLLSIWKRMNLL